MREADHYVPLVQGANAEGWRLYRIEDGSRGLKPFDVGGADARGLAVGLELKAVNQRRRDGVFPWTLFAEHQRNWLMAFQRLNAQALAIVYYALDREMCVYPLRVRDDFVRPESQMTRVSLRWYMNRWTGWSSLLR